MYNEQDMIEMAEKITFLAKRKKIPIKVLTRNCGIGINAISTLRQGKVMFCDSVAKIADCLDVSVDYLLGRTDVQEVNRGNVYNVQNSPMSAQGDNNSINVSSVSAKRDGMLDEMLKQFETLSFADKAEIMHIIAGKAKNEQAQAQG